MHQCLNFHARSRSHVEVFGPGRAEHTVYKNSRLIGETINRDELFKYSGGHFLANENKARRRRYVNFDVDRLCAIAAALGGQHSPVCEIEKMEGGFSKALLLRREDGTEIVAKMPFAIAGPPKYTTASEVAVLQYCKTL
jgi:hypothetical protein